MRRASVASSGLGESPANVVQGVFLASLFVGNFLLVAELTSQALEPTYRVLAALAFLLAYFTFRRIDLFSAWQRSDFPLLSVQLTFSSFSLVGLVLLIGYLINVEGAMTTRASVYWALSSPIVLLLGQAIFRWLARRLFTGLMRRRRAVIAFSSDASRKLAEGMINDPQSQFELIGFYEDREPDRVGSIPGLERLGNTRQMITDIENRQIEAVFVVLPEVGIKRTRSAIELLENTTASVFYVPDFFILGHGISRVMDVSGIPVLLTNETQLWGADGMLKRVIDLTLAALFLVICAPLMLLIALAIKLDDGGPVIFTQLRCGVNGEHFLVRKFRSMRAIQDDEALTGVPQAVRDDARITRVGRFLRATSLDELPQFVNVLRGNMSLVGPRPHALTHDEHYRAIVRRYIGRHKVLPGVTGLAQVRGFRGEIKDLEDMENRIRNDLEYIRQWTPGLDIKIILMTIPRMFYDNSAY